MDRLLIVDGIGPFFPRDAGSARHRWNWSKIPFSDFEDDHGLPWPERVEEITADFGRFCARVAALGFNGVTLDDLAHVAHWTGYRAPLRRKIDVFRNWYQDLFRIAEGHGLDVYLTTDVMSLTPEIVREIGGRSWRGGRTDKIPAARISKWLREACEQILVQFPAVRGIVLRIGECDGVDVEHDFRSRLVVRKPAQLRRILADLLPTFEQLHRLLFVRTWSVGAYRVGDLMWNRRTFSRVFDGLDSPSLVLSMKYGETDFFRFLPLNRHFFRSRHQKLIELQARREYEGFGEFPAFVGWQYERYRDELQQAPNVVGACIWCQTGGWSTFSRRTYLEDVVEVGSDDVDEPLPVTRGYWNELNTEVTIDLFRDSRGGRARAVTVEQAVRRFCTRRGAPERAPALMELLRLSDQVLADLLYVDELANQKLFFRRLRVPPLIAVYWDNILVNHWLRQIHRALVRRPEAKVRQGLAALEKLRRMIELAPRAGAPIEDLLFQYDTFEILAAVRRYIFAQDFDDSIAEELFELRDQYRRRWARRYEVHLDFRPVRLRSAQVRRILDLLVRRQRGYRRVDHVLTLVMLRWLVPVLRPFARKAGGELGESAAMGWESVFK